ncbi:MAG TPA: hypothetical protein VGC41_20560 [Kofleriaceae bacterium]
MVRIRTAWLVAVTALALGGAACKKGDDAKKADDKTAPAGGGGSAVAPSTDKPAGGGAVVSNGDDLSLLPADSDMVLGLNFAQLQQSVLWKQFGQKLTDKAAANFAEFKAACGFDPIDAIKSLSFGLKNVGDTTNAKPEGVMVIHGPDKAKVMACIDKAKDEAAKKGTELKLDGDVVLIKDKSGEQTAMTFVNDSTMIATIGAQGTTDGVHAAAKGGSALKTSTTFVEMYSKINAGESLWFLINGNSKLLEKSGSLGIKPKAVFGSLNVTDGLTVDVRIRLASADEVKGFVGMMQGQIGNPQVKSMVDTLDITGDANDARISVKMSQQKLQALIGMVGGMMGGMMGGGGMGGGGATP